jgi:hypothetical protein
MARIYADANGALLRLLKNADEEAQYGAPAGAVGTLDFDEATNAGVLDGIVADWDAHTLIGGVLSRAGVAVPIAAPGQQFAARQQLAAAKQTIQGNASGLSAYRGLSSPTNAQTVAAVKALCEDVAALTTILRALIREAN